MSRFNPFILAFVAGCASLQSASANSLADAVQVLNESVSARDDSTSSSTAIKRAERDSTRLFIKNASGKKLLVSIHYYNNTPGEATRGITENWHTAGWYTFLPGESANAVDVMGGHFFVTVYDPATGQYRSGSATVPDLRSRKTMPAHRFDLGDQNLEKLTVNIQ